jgi:hypothetical protein
MAGKHIKTNKLIEDDITACFANDFDVFEPSDLEEDFAAAARSFEPEDVIDFLDSPLFHMRF